MSHTPGPWTWTAPYGATLMFTGCRVNEGPILVGGDNTEVLNANSGEYSPVDNEDNARLIAAAPDLLEACKELMARIDGTMLHTAYTSVALEKGRAAIAKAERTEP